LAGAELYPVKPFPENTLTDAQRMIIQGRSFSAGHWFCLDSPSHDQAMILDKRTPQKILDFLLKYWNTEYFNHDDYQLLIQFCNDSGYVFEKSIGSANYESLSYLLALGLRSDLIDQEDLLLMSLNLSAKDFQCDIANRLNMRAQQLHFRKKAAIEYNEDDLFELYKFSKGRPWVASFQPTLSTHEMVLRLYQSRLGDGFEFYPNSPAYMDAIPYICRYRHKIAIDIFGTYHKDSARSAKVQAAIKAAVSALRKMPLRFRLMSTQGLIERARLNMCVYSTEQLRRMDIKKVFSAARTVDQSVFISKRIAKSAAIAQDSLLPDMVREELLMEDLGL
jgi:hypothetical protein